MIGRLAAGAGLAAIFLLMLPDPALLDIPIAFVVAAAALVAVGPSPLARPHGASRGAGARVAAVPGLLAAVGADVAAGTLRVALAVSGLRPPRAPGEVVVEVGRCSKQSLVVTGVLLTLSPGSILVSADPDAERCALRVHVVDGHDADAVRAQVTRLHERVQRVVGA